MAHWARIDENNIVVNVLVGNNDDTDEGHQWLIDNLGGTWLKTSYNTRNGVHYDSATGQPSDDQSKAFRGNFAGKGYSYDQELDAFFRPAPFASWVKSADYDWEAPVPYPSDGNRYVWDEDSVAWILSEPTPEP